MGVGHNHFSKISIFNLPNTTIFFIFVYVKHLAQLSLFILFISFASCKKYEDGPAISLLSKKARIANIWKVDTYYLNGKDKTTEYRQLVVREKLIFFQSGEFQYSELSNWIWVTPEYSGTWKFVNDKEEVELTPSTSTVKTKTYKILRLKNKSLWLEERVSSDSLVEYHFLPYTEN